jgi:UDP-4-amino-4,6-dideoxy-N-acetyl-beta-L-altrosamine transaminase
MIPYGRQDITESDIDAVLKVLRSDFLTQGPQVPIFEEKLANYSGASYAVAVNSATSALHIACLSLGLGEGDLLWTSPITFVASANCALYCGATIDFVDIDPKTNNMCPKALEKKLVEAKRVGRLPKILIPVHFSGSSCDMESIWSLAKRFGFRIIEDASHALGARYQSLPVGNCRYSDITVFSFHPVKIITTGEGGAALTNEASLAKRMSLLRSHGITRNNDEMSRIPDGPWYYEQIDLGFNYRLTDFQAALGVSQLDRLGANVARRHEIAKKYDKLLDNLPIKTPSQDSHYSALHLYVIRLDTKNIRQSHQEVFQALRDEGIGVNVHYIPVHLQPYYRDMGFKAGDFPEAEKYYSEAISLPIYPTLTEENQIKVVEALRAILHDSY